MFRTISRRYSNIPNPENFQFKPETDFWWKAPLGTIVLLMGYYGVQEWNAYYERAGVEHPITKFIRERMVSDKELREKRIKVLDELERAARRDIARTERHTGVSYQRDHE